MLKKIFIYLLLFTFHLENIKGKNITTTYQKNRATVVMDFEEQSNGDLILKKETEYVEVEESNIRKLRKFYVGEYKYKKKPLTVIRSFFYPNGDIWVRQTDYPNSEKESTTECWEENGTFIEDMTYQHINFDCN